MKRIALSLATLFALLPAPPSRAADPVHRADVDTIPTAAPAGTELTSAPLLTIYDNIAPSPTYFYRGQGGQEAIDDLHGTRSGVLTRVAFQYYEPGTATFAATVRVYGNPDGRDDSAPLIGGPYAVGGLEPGVRVVEVAVVGGPLVGPDLWVGVQFSSPTAGLALNDVPALGTSHDYYLENGTLYYFGGHPRANFGVRVAVRQPVVPGPDHYGVDEDGRLSIAAPGVLVNDGEEGGAGLTAALESGPAHGALALAADGSFTYQPDPDYQGTDGFTYRASRDVDLSALGAVTLDVYPANDAPEAFDDAYTMDEDGTLAGDVTTNDRDVDGDPLAVDLVTAPLHGTLDLAAGGAFAYAPAPNFHGADAFVYRLGDGRLPSGEARATITVRSVNDPPNALDDTTTARSGVPDTVEVIANDFDIDGEAVTVIDVTMGVHGAVAVVGPGSVVYTPTPSFVGRDSFAYTIADPLGAMATARVAVRVAFAGAAPEIIEGPYVHGGHAYTLLSYAPWEDSEGAAVALGGHLVTIDDAAEQAWVYETFTAGGTLERSLWIGLTDRLEEGAFAWASGEPVGFTHWLAGQPDQCGSEPENYALMLEPSSGSGGQWNDHLNEGGGGCGGQRYPHGVVEVPVVPCSLALAVTIEGQGTVSRSPDLPTYECDTPVELTASPSPGWEFMGWSGDASGADTAITIVMDRDRSITATFALEVEFDLWPSSVKTTDPESQRHIRATFVAPLPYSVDQVVVSSIRLNGVVRADTTAGPWLWQRHGTSWLTVAFRFADLYLVLPAGRDVALVATGMIGTDRFIGRDLVNTGRGKVQRPCGSDILTPGQPFTVRYEVPSDHPVESVELLSTFDGGATWTTQLSGLPNTGEVLWPVPNVRTETAWVAVVETETRDDAAQVVGVIGVSEVFSIAGTLAIDDAPASLDLAPAVPTPSAFDVRLRCALPRRGLVSLEIVDLQGRRIRTLFSGMREAGMHEAVWRGESDGGGRTEAGIYFALLRAQGRVLVRKVVRL